MPFIIATKDGKRFGLPRALFTAHEIGRLRDDNHCYKIINTTSRRVSSVGAACRKPTPEHLWGARGRGRKGRGGLGASFFEKLLSFGKKKKPKRRVGDQRIYYVPYSRGGRTVSERGPTAMAGARRRKRRRR